MCKCMFFDSMIRFLEMTLEEQYLAMLHFRPNWQLHMHQCTSMVFTVQWTGTIAYKLHEREQSYSKMGVREVKHDQGW